MSREFSVLICAGDDEAKRYVGPEGAYPTHRAGLDALEAWLLVSHPDLDWLDGMRAFKAEADAVIARHTGRNDESPADRLAARELRPANGLDKRLQRGWHVVVFHQAPADLVAVISLVTSRDQPSAVLKAAMDGDIGRRIKADNPAPGQALLGYIVAVMSERLSFASRVIGVLQR